MNETIYTIVISSDDLKMIVYTIRGKDCILTLIRLEIY